MTPKDGHALILRNLKYVPFHDSRDFEDVIKVANVERARLSGNIQEDPMQSHESSKAENFSQLWTQTEAI